MAHGGYGVLDVHARLWPLRSGFDPRYSPQKKLSTVWYPADGDAVTSHTYLEDYSPIDVDALLRDLPPEPITLEHWVGTTKQEPTITHPRVARSDGGGVCPEQHYGMLTDSRAFYYRYRHGYASLQVVERPPGVYDLPITNPDYDREAHIAAIEADEEYTGPSFWVQPYVELEIDAVNDSGYFRNEKEKLDVFSMLLALVDQYDAELAEREYAGFSVPLAQEYPWGL